MRVRHVLLFSQEAVADGIRWQNLCSKYEAHERKNMKLDQTYRMPYTYVIVYDEAGLVKDG